MCLEHFSLKKESAQRFMGFAREWLRAEGVMCLNDADKRVAQGLARNAKNNFAQPK